MVEYQSSVIHRISKSEGETRGYYRLLENEKVTENDLIYEIQRQCLENITDQRVLVFGDSCTISLENSNNRLVEKEGLYNIGQNQHQNGVSLGMIIHPLLVHDRDTGTPRGIANVKILERPLIGNKRSSDWNRKSWPIEEKESYKWISTCLDVKETVLSKPKHKLFVMDREADVIDIYDKLKTKSSDVLVRSNYNRNVIDDRGDTCKIDELLARQEIQGSIEVEVKEKKRKKRIAKLSVRIAQAKLPWPGNRKVIKKIHPNGIKVSIIEVREIEHKGYKNEPPLIWRLITTEVIDDFEKAIEIIHCYRQRWKIEELFKLMKTDGFNIEATELTKGRCIRKLTLLIMKSSIKILQLKSARNGESSIKVAEVFNKEECECLIRLNTQLSGDTIKQQNPHNTDSLSWATWIIARLGGWKEFYNKKRPPGNKTLVWGLEKFEAIMVGYNISKIKDVS